MTLIVENGTGIFEANGYAGRGYVRQYLKSRNRAVEWDAATEAQRDASIIAATDYIDRRFGSRFRGFKQYRDISVAASNILQIRSNPLEDDTVTIGTITYKFVETATAPYEITIGDTLIVSSQRLVDAVNGVGVPAAHPGVSAAATDSPGDVIVRALVAGMLQTAIPTTSNNPRLVWDTESLDGGLDHTEQFLEFPRINLFTPSGGQVIGVPEKLRQATAEYASRAIAQILMPDPASTNQPGELTKFVKRIGPIQIEEEYAPGTVSEIFKKFPTADRLLREFLRAAGEVYR